MEQATVIQKTGKVISGTVISILLGLLFLMIGLALCFTIIGAIIGIPLVLFGVTGIIVSPFVGMGLVTKKTEVCPKCGGTVSFISLQRMARCKSCHQYIKIEKGHLVS